MKFTPDLNTLRCLLKRDDIYPAAEIDLCVQGMLPHVFSCPALALNKIRERFYTLAQETESTERECLNFAKILVEIQPRQINDFYTLAALKMAAEQISWKGYRQKSFWLDWPSIHYLTSFPHIKTACRLMILVQLWGYCPRLIEQDLTLAIEDFSDENRKYAFAFLERQAHSPIEMTDEIRMLLNALASGPLTSRELQSKLHIKRGILLKKYLYPARILNLITQTCRSSSAPAQQYMLVKP